MRLVSHQQERLLARGAKGKAHMGPRRVVHTGVRVSIKLKNRI